MNNKNLTIGLIVVAIIAIGGYFYPQVGSKLGAILDTSYFDYFQASTSGGFKVGSNTIINGSGNISQPTTNTATSTATVGCVQTYATSTATAVRMTFSLPSQNAATTTSQGGSSIGNVVWQYGVCPI